MIVFVKWNRSTPHYYFNKWEENGVHSTYFVRYYNTRLEGMERDRKKDGMESGLKKTIQKH